MCHNTHSPTRATSTLPSWVSDMMAHVVPDRVAEFSISGTGDDVSVFWEPDLSYTDPFVLPASSFQPPSGQNLEFPILPSPVPDAKSSKLGTDALLPSHASRARHGGTALEHLIRVIDAMQNAERKGSEGKHSRDTTRKPKLIEWQLVVRAQDIRNTRKWNLDDVDIDPTTSVRRRIPLQIMRPSSSLRIMVFPVPSVSVARKWVPNGKRSLMSLSMARRYYEASHYCNS
ncbi:hypothetical protein C8R48DRAFT_676480, partial [Suillus tomentosus]